MKDMPFLIPNLDSAVYSEDRLRELHSDAFAAAAGKLCIDGKFPPGQIHWSKCIHVSAGTGRIVMEVCFGGKVQGSPPFASVLNTKKAKIELDSRGTGRFDYEEAVMKLLLLL